MPFLALAIPHARANAPSPSADATNTTNAGARRHEVVIDMQEIRNQLPQRDAGAQTATSPFETFRRVFECRLIPVNAYFDHALAEFVTPRSECAPRAYASNAELRTALTEILRFHPHGRALDVQAQLVAAGLPSLLRDEPDYLPGTLSALRYDIGANSVRIGRFEFPGSEPPGQAEYLFAGESELAFLHEGNRHAPRVRRDHASILDFHYRAVGMRAHTALPPVGYANAAQDETQLSDFTAQLARCRHRDDPGRTSRNSASRPHAFSPLDTRQNDLICSIL
ncbi:hypothetical protein [Pandoraea anhela]|uniref:Uncharacterized protein n=1 Tax=Pandoraea anhela TaxID=2508295 RepID=A0A5E4T661_9BURK|nr:hypothetical protein [Pandoraea anhela]VVD82682.1 hypothetical protein PAN31108_01189 [Pandoraea anhela]